MKKQELRELKFLRFMLPLFSIGGVITLLKAGYLAGQELFVVLH